MAISVFDLFSIGIGPSSSHTVGPMRAAKRFIERLARQQQLPQVARVRVELYGSLGATGKGHGTDIAVLLGLMGEAPEHVDPDGVAARIAAVQHSKSITLLGTQPLPFDPVQDLAFLRDKHLALHSNAMCCMAFDAQGRALETRLYYSVGGGFVVDEETAEGDKLVRDTTVLPYHFTSGDEMLAMGRAHSQKVHALMLANEMCWRTEPEIRAGLLHLWSVMQACVQRACRASGTLPGGLKVTRRAPRLYAELQQREGPADDHLTVLDWVNLYALAVNEENAAGGRVVTAPTNGAAGILPSVMLYYARHTPNASEDGIIHFMLTAGAIGILYKERASISGAEVGCQGEVGVACSMAAAGLVAALGGTNEQMENAAEIGMEHNLGLTCDPVGGLVQIPCIERNAMGAVKAINASRLALRGDGSHKVSLDKVIETMRQTGADMMTKYKETARGGLAINVIEC